MQSSFSISAARRVYSSVRSPQAIALFSGCLGGLYVVSWLHQLTATFGTSLSIVVALCFSLALGWELGWRPSEGSRLNIHANRQFPLLQFTLAAWTVAFPWLLELAVWTAGRFPLETMAEPLTGFLFTWVSALVLLAAPAAALGRLPHALHTFNFREGGAGEDPDCGSGQLEERKRSTLARRFLHGFVVGLVVDLFVLAPLVGVHMTAMLAALAGSILFLFCIHRSPEPESAPPIGVSANSPEPTSDDSAPLRPSVIDSIWVGAAILCLGALTAVLGRVTQQLLASVNFVVYVEWAALLTGLVLGWSWSDRRAASGSRSFGLASGSSLLAAACGAATLAAFPLLVNASLAANSHVSSVGLLMLFRSSLAALVFLPVGIAWGSIVAASRNQLAGSSSSPTRRAAGASRRTLPSLKPFAFVVGYLGVRLILLPLFSVPDLLLTTVFVLTALAAIRAFAGRALPVGWPVRGAVLAATCLVAAGFLLRGSYRPDRSAKLLFATSVFVAKQSGTSAELLTALDEGRHVTTFEGDRGTYTVWSYRGAQLHLRESGVPKGVVSANPDVCPQASVEVMPAALPLTLHESPRRVLLLGLGGGTALTTCLNFPLEELTCVDADSRLIQLLDDVVWPAAGLDPLADDRVRFHRIDPALAASCRPGEYEVIVSIPDQPSLTQSTPYFTREFYERVSRSLAPDGIFCQKFQQIDFGPKPFESAVKSLATAFLDVAAVETGPGEVVLLGSNAPGGVVRDGLIERFQRPQVRRTLSRLGWDWVVPLNLTAYDHDGLNKRCEEASAQPNTTGNGRFAFRLAQEVMRWGAKWQEKRSALSPHARRLLEWENVDGDSPVVLRRLGEVTGQRKLVYRATDQPWAYRKMLREQIKNRPRTAIEKIAYRPDEGRLHPEDERRIAYLTALGKAARQADPDEQDIVSLQEYTSPYDPLISYFVHHEMARLYARSSDHDPASELAHRLHTVYYADSTDRSVRNVVAALRLLVEHPEATATPLERWDGMNSLMQVLKMRWEARRNSPTTSTRILLNDVEKSISALEAALAEMDALQAELQLSETDWQARRAWLDRTLVRPLRTYRSRLLPHHFQQQRAKAKKAAAKPKTTALLPGQL